MSLLTHVFFNAAHEADFTMRVVGPGDSYGKDMCLTHTEDDPLVEFYDKRWDHDEGPDGEALGQFVSRYYLSTLLEPSRGGGTAFDTGLTLDGGAAWRVAPEGMQNCLQALRDAGLASDPSGINVRRIIYLSGKIDREMYTRLDYAETHPDAGDAYTHLPREGSWQNSNGDARLAGYIAHAGIDTKGLMADEVSELVLDNFRMEPGGILDPGYENDDLFVVGSFPVTEIEERIDMEVLDPNATSDEWAAAMKHSGAHFDNGLGYLTSSRIWRAVIDRETLEEVILDRAPADEADITP